MTPRIVEIMRWLLVMLFAATVVACQSDAQPVAGEPGTPLPGLSPADSARFFAGSTLFNKIFTPETGLGPAFNENQCSACHTVPAPGGTTGFERVVKATRYAGPGECNLLSEKGGENIRTQATPLLRGHGFTHESVPPDATETGRFLPPFLFGLGLVEAIPEDVITAGEDPEDEDGDGISGRAARGPDGRVTRFGRKADVATIEDFTRSALLLEMGLTTRAADRDRVAGGDPPAGTDPVAEPEIDDETVALLTAFTRFLTPTAPVQPFSREQADSIATGARLFDRIGCARCHTPAMRTAATDNPALSNKTVQLYSDLLLHDMGPQLANICAYDASPRELRTSLLMGLQHRSFYLHDGRAIDLRDAILAHGGEAQRSRDTFARLPYMSQEHIVIFLRSL